MRNDISYIVLSYNPKDDAKTAELLEQVVDALMARKSKTLKADVTILDNGSGYAHKVTIEELKYKHHVNVWYMDKNLGIARAINLFARSCRAKVIGLITCDAIVTTGMDEDLFEKLMSSKEVYQVVPVAHDSQLTYQQFLDVGDKKFGDDNVDLTPLGGGVTRCIGIEYVVTFWKRRVFDSIGYLDERWKAQFECNDFSLRCFLDGGVSVVSNESFAWHYNHLSMKTDSWIHSHDGYLYDATRRPTQDEVTKLQLRWWHQKWPLVDSIIDKHSDLGDKTIEDFPEFKARFDRNRHLQYIQDVPY